MASARLLSKNIILSRKLNVVSEGAENLYYRLLVMSDDFGCYHADSSIIKGKAYTLRKISLSTIEKRLLELKEIHLIKMYSVNGEYYIQIKKFEEYQRFRSDIKRKSEYPQYEQRSRNESERIRTNPNVHSSLVSRSNNENNNENEKKIDEIISKWNAFSNEAGLSPVLKLNDFRKTKILTRIKEKEFMFDAILKAIRLSPHLLGESEGGWRCSLDWIIKNDTNYVKVLEGQYYARKKQTTKEKIDAWAKK